MMYATYVLMDQSHKMWSFTIFWCLFKVNIFCFDRQAYSQKLHSQQWSKDWAAKIIFFTQQWNPLLLTWWKCFTLNSFALHAKMCSFENTLHPHLSITPALSCWPAGHVRQGRGGGGGIGSLDIASLKAEMTSMGPKHQPDVGWGSMGSAGPILSQAGRLLNSTCRTESWIQNHRTPRLQNSYGHSVGTHKQWLK